MKRFILFLSVAVLAVCAVVPAQTTRAIAPCDKEFYKNNNVYFFNECEENVCQGGSSSALITSLKGTNNAEKIYGYWLDSGFVKEQSAGVTAVIKAMSGFSPFRQEEGVDWPDGGWGIAKFSGGAVSETDPGYRAYVSGLVSAYVGTETFNSYYTDDYGGPVLEADGYIPNGVPVEVNDAFLLAELNYLRGELIDKSIDISGFSPYSSNITTQPEDGMTVYEYLSSLTSASDVAKAFTYLYNPSSDALTEANTNASTAEELLTLLSGAQGTNGCGPTPAGMTKDEASAFMEIYKKINNSDPNGDLQYVKGSRCNTDTDNCVRFSSYFLNKYTTLTFQGGNGGFVLNNLVAKYPEVETGSIPRAYALFSIYEGVTDCGGTPCGHTGVVLGVNEEAGKVYVGEAAWCKPGFTGVHEYSLEAWSDGRHRYAYLDNYLRPERMADL